MDSKTTYLIQIVVHGYMESDTYSPLLNISVIPQVRIYDIAFLIWRARNFWKGILLFQVFVTFCLHLRQFTKSIWHEHIFKTFWPHFSTRATQELKNVVKVLRIYMPLHFYSKYSNTKKGKQKLRQTQEIVKFPTPNIPADKMQWMTGIFHNFGRLLANSSWFFPVCSADIS